MSSALESLEPVSRTETLGARVRSELHRAIMAGRFQPGQKLTIRAVADALGVSLTPAREALYNLVAEGVLDVRANRSIYVPELDEARIRELTKIRVALEGLAARSAASLATDEEIAFIVQCNDALIAANEAGNFRSVIAHNWVFHFAIYEAAQMPVLLRMIESCWLVTGSYLNVIYPEFGRLDDGIRNHLAIIDALVQRDPERLARTVCRDIEFSSSALLETIAARGHRSPEKD